MYTFREREKEEERRELGWRERKEARKEGKHLANFSCSSLREHFVLKQMY